MCGCTERTCNGGCPCGCTHSGAPRVGDRVRVTREGIVSGLHSNGTPIVEGMPEYTVIERAKPRVFSNGTVLAVNNSSRHFKHKIGGKWLCACGDQQGVCGDDAVYAKDVESGALTVLTGGLVE